MPKAAREKTKHLIHPNSRKALQIARSSHKHNKKLGKLRDKASKLDGIVKKLLWFQENMDENVACYDKHSLASLVQRYIERFSQEMEQIDIVRSVGCRNSTQHMARERSIKLAQEQETMLFNSSGIEIPDLLNTKILKEFKSWDGDAKSLPKLKLIKFTKPKIQCDT